MTAYTDIPAARTYVEYDEDTERFFNMRERDHERRSTTLQSQYRAH